MNTRKYIAHACCIASMAVISACSGNGAPNNGDIEKAIEDATRFEMRQRMGDKVADIDVSDVSAKDCIAKDAEWICRVEAKISMKRMYNGNMEPHEEKFSGDVRLNKTDNGWVMIE